MMLFPEAQRKAQEEIDALLGDENRLPNWEEYVPQVTRIHLTVIF